MPRKNDNTIKRIEDSNGIVLTKVSDGTIRNRDNYAAETDEIHLREYVGRVYRHKFIVLGVVAVFMAATIVYLFAKQRVYRADARVQVDFDNSAAIPIPASGQNPFI